jgi:predicted SAM-dependent methyltransferase
MSANPRLIVDRVQLDKPLRRLQLGTSRLEMLKPAAQKVFLDQSWVHLGEPPRRNLAEVVRRLLGWLPGRQSVESLYRRTDFRQFWFDEGDRFDFEDSDFSFIYSEHFLEHVTPAAATSLFQEAYRLLQPGGVIRTVVPDAVFRTYEPPEPPNYPSYRPEGHPNKHKIRWSVYSLTEVLQAARFRVVPIEYCTKDREHIRKTSEELSENYVGCVDSAMVTSRTYIMRIPSLIVDGIRD